MTHFEFDHPVLLTLLTPQAPYPTPLVLHQQHMFNPSALELLDQKKRQLINASRFPFTNTQINGYQQPLIYAPHVQYQLHQQLTFIANLFPFTITAPVRKNPLTADDEAFITRLTASPIDVATFTSLIATLAPLRTTSSTLSYFPLINTFSPARLNLHLSDLLTLMHLPRNALALEKALVDYCLFMLVVILTDPVPSARARWQELMKQAYLHFANPLLKQVVSDFDLNLETPSQPVAVALSTISDLCDDLTLALSALLSHFTRTFYQQGLVNHVETTLKREGVNLSPSEWQILHAFWRLDAQQGGHFSYLEISKALPRPVSRQYLLRMLKALVNQNVLEASSSHPTLFKFNYHRYQIHYFQSS